MSGGELIYWLLDVFTGIAVLEHSSLALVLPTVRNLSVKQLELA